MTISTPPASPRPASGFTLVEVLIATALSGLVLAAVLSLFVFQTRTGFRASSYSEMEAELRRGLDRFALDARNATDVRWNNSQSVTLTVAGAPVTYAYDADPRSATYRTFYRLAGDAASPAARLALIHDLDGDFSFKRYKLAQAGATENYAANDNETKQLQLTLRAARTNRATVGATNSAISARYVLRNKRVTN